MFEEEDEDIVDNPKIVNLIKYLKDQIKEIEKQAEVRAKDFNKNLMEIKNIEINIKSKEYELETFKKFFPNYFLFEEERKKLSIVDEIMDLESSIEELELHLNILQKTVSLQKLNIDTEIKKIVDLNVNLSWLVR